MTSRHLSVLVALGLAFATWGAPGAQASDTHRAAASHFPTKAEVKEALNGTGRWDRGPFDVAAVGARPAACRSDLQMLNFSSVRARFYRGAEPGMPTSTSTSARVAVFSYPDVASASAAVANNATYPQRCHKVVEWVCNDCDGIWTTWRTSVTSKRLGAQSTLVRTRELGNFPAKGWTMLARRGSTVVRVTVDRTNELVDEEMTHPRRPDRKSVRRLTRAALRAAS